MNKNTEILIRLDKIVSKQPSKWHKEAKFRTENKEWLRRSQAISLKILLRLRELGLSQVQLSEKMNVSPQQINKWVKGKENLGRVNIKTGKCFGFYNYTYSRNLNIIHKLLI